VGCDQSTSKLVKSGVASFVWKRRGAELQEDLKWAAWVGGWLAAMDITHELGCSTRWLQLVTGEVISLLPGAALCPMAALDAVPLILLPG
jgi:hypothetical protein